jgi:hypothetical protein
LITVSAAVTAAAVTRIILKLAITVPTLTMPERRLLILFIYKVFKIEKPAYCGLQVIIDICADNSDHL